MGAKGKDGVRVIRGLDDLTSKEQNAILNQKLALVTSPGGLTVEQRLRRLEEKILGFLPLETEMKQLEEIALTRAENTLLTSDEQSEVDSAAVAREAEATRIRDTVAVSAAESERRTAEEKARSEAEAAYLAANAGVYTVDPHTGQLVKTPHPEKPRPGA